MKKAQAKAQSREDEASQDSELGDFASSRELPSDWRVMLLGDLGEVRYGLGQPPELADDGVPMVRATNVKRGRIVHEGLIRIRRDAIPASRNAYLKRGEIVVVRSGAYTGDVAMVTSEWAGSVAGYDLVFSPSNELVPEFGAAALLSYPVQRYFHGQRDRSAQPHLNRHQVENTVIPVPPLSEQRRIAGVLGLVQRAVEQQERLRTLVAELKQTLLHHLFTHGLRGEPQKQTDLGPIPQSWEVVRLEDVAKIERGKFTHRPRNEPRFYGGQIPFVQTGDVSRCDGKISRYSQTLNDEGLRISKMFPAGTILITIAANIGFTGILEFDSACPDSLIGLTPNSRTDAEFLQHYLTTQQAEMDRLAPRGTQKNITNQFLRPWPVRLPSKDEQHEIVNCLNAVDSKMRLHRRKHAALTSLFRTLLHQLMTAQLRVADLDVESLLAPAVPDHPPPRREPY